MDIYGYMEFTGNSADSAAALELLSFGQIQLRSGLKMNFTGNSGRLVQLLYVLWDSRLNCHLKKFFEVLSSYWTVFH